MDGISTLSKGTRDNSRLFPQHENAIRSLWPGRESSPDHAGTLILDFQPLAPWGMYFLGLQAICSVVACMAARWTKPFSLTLSPWWDTPWYGVNMFTCWKAPRFQALGLSCRLFVSMTQWGHCWFYGRYCETWKWGKSCWIIARVELCVQRFRYEIPFTVKCQGWGDCELEKSR